MLKYTDSHQPFPSDINYSEKNIKYQLKSNWTSYRSLLNLKITYVKSPKEAIKHASLVNST